MSLPRSCLAYQHHDPLLGERHERRDHPALRLRARARFVSETPETWMDARRQSLLIGDSP
jgi:hypothetical protein